MSDILRSVGLDVGTTSTQMIFSELTVENKASGFAVPEMEIARRDIRYRSPVYFTPLLDESHVDAGALRELVAEEYREKLKARIAEYLGGAGIDEGRILTEAAVFADKSNIDEELTRLFSHIAQFRSIAEEGIVGRKLDFLVQEFNREANTTCSKSNDIALTRTGLALKNEIEKVREQVQNLE